MPGLNRVGEVKYNGWLFPPALSAKVAVTPVYDSSQRTIKYRTFSVTIDVVVSATDFAGGTSGQALDDHLTLLRKRLLAPGKRFVFTGQGLGNDLDVSYNSVVGFGPDPQELLWEPIGSSLAARLVWKVSFNLTDCDYYQSGNIGEYNWSVSWNIDNKGLTTRTISGILEILVQRSSDGSHITDTADAYRGLIKFPLLESFTRQQSYNLSNDRRFLNFTITDTELPTQNPYYPGIVRMDVRHRLARPGLMISGMWTFNISGTIEVAHHTKKYMAWMAFHNVVKSRVETALEVIDARAKKAEKGSPNEKAFFLFYDLSIEEDIYGLSMSFSITYKTTVNLQDLIAASGLFTPVPGDWTKWKTSLNDAYTQRGIAKLAHDKGDDVIITYCQPGDTTVGGYGLRPTLQDKPPYAIYSPKCPKKESSWLYYYNDVSIESLASGGLILHKLSPNASGELVTLDANPGGLTGTIASIGTSPGSSNERTVSVHTRTDATRYLVLTGSAGRVCYKFEKEDLPYAETICGTSAYLVESSQDISKPPGNLGEFPFFMTSWRLVYLLPCRTGTYTLRNIKKGLTK